MKHPVLFLLLLSAVSRMVAVETVQLTDEEVRLVRAYRSDPTLFRQIMKGNGGGANQISVGYSAAVIGPRDVIDVSIIGGKVQFYGKNSEFNPVSFRISRGETKAITFRKKDAITETRAVVSYRADGLHFDIPEAYGGTTSEENGLLIIGESAAWDNGDVTAYPGKITALGTTTKGENLQFKIRYALLTGHRSR